MRVGSKIKKNPRGARPEPQKTELPDIPAAPDGRRTRASAYRPDRESSAARSESNP